MEKILIEPKDGLVVSCLSNLLETSAEKALAGGDTFKVGLSGGSLVKLLAQSLPNITTDWSKWYFFFCDERIVPFDTADSTYGEYKAKLIGKIPVTDDQFIKINPDLSAEEAAKDYIKKMSVFFPPDRVPCFDVLLLGLGPDGHTCSLFPGHKVLNETSLWVCPINDSPKPPPSRITLTLPVINNAKKCVFAITGSGKAEMVKKILQDRENLPAARVQPHNGELYWILDEDAAKLLDMA
ncbi:6-phosphogluconolactonase [Hylaeus volcanicus]|uniref:6-phosphogluconolactonase n=1 Tax=Hylaeus volcanicus TaxID=313075 RepID=UPI0023B824B4|nr:6-phosphogluconolactonase [Hylaeus volcanicus]XP_053971508.1 6-phosphogluconolactonase [Hylaeus volcanicus]XP_053971509.1 6-phosphogluconolactonase [Hylaeus volcanicus]